MVAPWQSPVHSNQSREVGALEIRTSSKSGISVHLHNDRGYRPFIAGSAQPVNVFRKYTYLSTQSIVHANVKCGDSVAGA
jgi:hypothetical protein